MYVHREAQRGPAWIEQSHHALGWLAWGLAGWLRHREPRRTLDSSCQVCSVWFCCLAILGLEERWGSSCRVCMYVCMYCLVFFSCIFEPRRTLGLQLSGTYCVVFFVWQLRAPRKTGAPAVGYVLCGLFVWQLQAPRKTGAPAVGYVWMFVCMYALSCLF